ncbi:hypothetical protein AYM40_06585 [Paraburkholderia phytofirmans OLGA172]|uniref:Uncharacterized protein n=2 Tax=Paraburkholderia phytofirmans TaxID=261302 RepID=A0A160FIX0_9BURK|nr:hypothetical protein AYM40_06585 [Paraburkholderia phytofirmans OLGA172]
MMENEIAHELFDGKYGRPTLEDYKYVLRQDSNSYRGKLAARVVQLFLDCLAAEDQLYAPLRASCMVCDEPSSDESQGPMPFRVTYEVGMPYSEALAYATHIMARLDDGTDPHFWSNVDIVWRWDWIPAETREEGEALEAERDAFFCAVDRCVSWMRKVEYQWDRLGQPLRRLLVSSPITAGEALALIVRMLRIGDAVDENQLHSLADEVWKMIRRRIGKPAWYPHPVFR